MQPTPWRLRNTAPTAPLQSGSVAMGASAWHLPPSAAILSMQWCRCAYPCQTWTAHVAAFALLHTSHQPTRATASWCRGQWMSCRCTSRGAYRSRMPAAKGTECVGSHSLHPQERFDRPLDGRVELGGCGGGLTSFADLPAAQLTDVQATGWVASDHNCPQTWCAPKPSVPSLQCPGPRCGRHSWSAVPDDADNPVLLLLPGRHWCYVGQVGHSVTLQVGVVAGSSTRWVGGVLYDEDGALVDAFVGQDVMDKA